LASDDFWLLQLAFEAHDGQKRKSGEPFIIHPVEVARILGELVLKSILFDIILTLFVTSFGADSEIWLCNYDHFSKQCIYVISSTTQILWHNVLKSAYDAADALT
jgi:hypothetical protein